MPAALQWTHAQDTRIRQMRAEGATWDAIGLALGVYPQAAQHHGLQIGASPPPPDFVPERDGWLDGRRSSLPAGHPVTWGLLTAGTCLEGAAYDGLPR